ncbi:hypothetical protein [Thalassotalea atypica]|uniref:hypothetical protein n=1 Tax=Thalassotalea atypica TaxID=2054316 RepID=UPI0025745ABA|nr:hypothetical protein [Thalassotalea atypica]
MAIDLLICSDIFGHTSQLSNFIERFEANGVNTHLVTPYHADKDDTAITFTGCSDLVAGEKAVYRTFVKQCGHDAYLEKVILALQTLLSQDSQFIVLGFSAGASACWRALSKSQSSSTSARRDTTHVKHFIGFYPSQIRHYLDLRMNCPSTIIFPDSEPHFDVDIASKKLKMGHLTSCIKAPWQHGFFNSLSPNFEQDAINLYLPLLTNIRLLSTPTLLRNEISNLSY